MRLHGCQPDRQGASHAHSSSSLDLTQRQRRIYFIAVCSRSTLLETSPYHQHFFSVPHMNTFLNRDMSGPNHALCLCGVAKVVTG